MRKEKGFTLIEILIYLFVVGVVASLVMVFFSNIISSFGRISEKNFLQTNLQSSMDFIISQAREAKSIYTKTSIFNTDSGQLSLETKKDPPVGHSKTYIDFYLDNGVLYQKREIDSLPVAITPFRVKVTKFFIERFTLPSGKEIVKITIGAEYNSLKPKKAGYELSSSVTLRGAY